MQVAYLGMARPHEGSGRGGRGGWGSWGRGIALGTDAPCPSMGAGCLSASFPHRRDSLLSVWGRETKSPRGHRAQTRAVCGGHTWLGSSACLGLSALACPRGVPLSFASTLRAPEAASGRYQASALSGGHSWARRRLEWEETAGPCAPGSHPSRPLGRSLFLHQVPGRWILLPATALALFWWLSLPLVPSAPRG